MTKPTVLRWHSTFGYQDGRPLKSSTAFKSTQTFRRQLTGDVDSDDVSRKLLGGGELDGHPSRRGSGCRPGIF